MVAAHLLRYTRRLKLGALSVVVYIYFSLAALLRISSFIRTVGANRKMNTNDAAVVEVLGGAEIRACVMEMMPTSDAHQSGSL